VTGVGYSEGHNKENAPHLKKEPGPYSETTLFSISFGISGYGKSPNPLLISI
jgi:hypothetical protein